MDKPGQRLLILGKAGALIQQTPDLPFQFPDRPVPCNAFDFIKKTFKRIIKLDDFHKMAE